LELRLNFLPHSGQLNTFGAIDDDDSIAFVAPDDDDDSDDDNDDDGILTPVMLPLGVIIGIGAAPRPLTSGAVGDGAAINDGPITACDNIDGDAPDPINDVNDVGNDGNPTPLPWLLLLAIHELITQWMDLCLWNALLLKL
jgi:hypothetical protein